MDENERKVMELRVDPNTGDVVDMDCSDKEIATTNPPKPNTTVDISNKREFCVEIHPRLMNLMNLSTSEELLAYHLLEYVSLKDNVLKYQGKPLDIKTIAILLEREYESTRQIMRRLINKGVIAMIYLYHDTKDKKLSKAYIFNPYIATKEERIPGYILSIFQKFGWGIQPCKMDVDKPLVISDVKESFYAVSTKSYLYIIYNSSNNYIKIGVTNNIDRRLAELQTASADILHILYISPKCDNAYEFENKIHDHFSKYRKNGEWFNISPYIAIAYIESLFDNSEIVDR